MARRIWPCDPEVFKDRVQSFYLNLIRYRVLQRFDPRRGAYNTYVLNSFKWVVEHEGETMEIPESMAAPATEDSDLVIRLQKYQQFVEGSGCRKLGSVLAEMRRRMADEPVKNRSAASKLRVITRRFLASEGAENE